MARAAICPRVALLVACALVGVEAFGRKKAPPPPPEPSAFVTLAIKLAVDAAAAALTALAVAPLIAAFDEAITKAAAGDSLWGALGARLLSVVRAPRAFFGSTAFRWMWIVYAATYATSNALKSAEAAAGVPFGFASTLAVTLVNMSCGIAKDAAYAKLFAAKDGGGKATPPAALLVWFARDFTAFSFILTLPPRLAAGCGVSLELAQFLTPVLGQYFTTPLHVLGVNMCNMPGATLGQQLARVGPGLPSTVLARQMRIIPPYSIGGVLNSHFLSAAPLALRLAKR